MSNRIHGRPTEPGWYWLCEDGHDARCVRVSNKRGVMVMRDADGLDLDLMDGSLIPARWYGPINPPPGEEP